MTFVCRTCQKLWTPEHRHSCHWWPGKGCYSFAEIRQWVKLREQLKALPPGEELDA